MKAAYLKRVIWPAMYITAIIMSIWFLFVGGLCIALIAVGDKSLPPLLSLTPIPSVISAGTVFMLCLLGGHSVYRLSNGKEWIRFEYLIPKSLLTVTLLIGALMLSANQSAIAAPIPFAGAAGIMAIERAKASYSCATCHRDASIKLTGTIVGGRALPASLWRNKQ